MSNFYFLFKKCIEFRATTSTKMENTNIATVEKIGPFDKRAIIVSRLLIPSVPPSELEFCGIIHLKYVLHLALYSGTYVHISRAIIRYIIIIRQYFTRSMIIYNNRMTLCQFFSPDSARLPENIRFWSEQYHWCRYHRRLYLRPLHTHLHRWTETWLRNLVRQVHRWPNLMIVRKISTDFINLYLWHLFFFLQSFK